MLCTCIRGEGVPILCTRIRGEGVPILCTCIRGEGVPMQVCTPHSIAARQAT